MKTNPMVAGFSLVEVSLALLVVGVGLLAVFGLFPDGLSASRKAVEANEIAAFAEYVFSSLELEAAVTNAPWATFANGNLQLMKTHAIKGAADDTQTLVEADGNNQANRFDWIPDYYGWTYVDSYINAATFTYTLDIESIPGEVGKLARLEVWAGEYPPSTVPKERGVVFYREYLPIE